MAFAAGGAADTVARNVGARVSEILGQQVIIDNRTGGNSLVAAGAVLQAPRDGETFLIDAANQVTNPFLIKDLPFDYAATWMPVTKLSDFPQVVAVNQDFRPGRSRNTSPPPGRSRQRSATARRPPPAWATWRARSCSGAPASSLSMSATAAAPTPRATSARAPSIR